MKCFYACTKLHVFAPLSVINAVKIGKKVNLKFPWSSISLTFINIYHFVHLALFNLSRSDIELCVSQKVFHVSIGFHGAKL